MFVQKNQKYILTYKLTTLLPHLMNHQSQKKSQYQLFRAN